MMLNVGIVGQPTTDAYNAYKTDPTISNTNYNAFRALENDFLIDVT